MQLNPGVSKSSVRRLQGILVWIVFYKAYSHSLSSIPASNVPGTKGLLYWDRRLWNIIPDYKVGKGTPEIQSLGLKLTLSLIGANCGGLLSDRSKLWRFAEYVWSCLLNYTDWPGVPGTRCLCLSSLRCHFTHLRYTNSSAIIQLSKFSNFSQAFH